MTTSLNTLVSELPEIYQTIYGHPEWDHKISRDCNERLTLINEQYDQLSQNLGRPLRVLDLGCAQGFFSLNLANRGASVKGIDFQQENIAVCQALAEENPELDATFTVGRIEDVITQLEDNDYDLVIGLSVFHHIIHLHGIETVKNLLSHLADRVQLLILEIAVKEEPLYWSVSQPNDPSELIEQCAFYRIIGQFETHLSPVPRPMYVISNKRVIFDNFSQEFSHWRDYPYSGANQAHEKSRRYYFGDNYVCKYFYYTSYDNMLTSDVSQRNRYELTNEANLLANPPSDFKTPQLFAHGDNENFGWLVMEKLPGMLLSDLLKQNAPIDAQNIIATLLEELVKLEAQGLWHDDLRPWNVMVDDKNHARLIDFGSIVTVPRDCSWPANLILSFFVFVNEIVDNSTHQHGYWRTGQINPFNLPHPWSGWLYKMWQEPVNKWSFTLAQQFFENKEQLPRFEESQTAVEQWISSYETVLLKIQTRDLVESQHNDAISAHVEALQTELDGVKNEIGTIPRVSSADVNIEVQSIIESHAQLNWLSENIENLEAVIFKVNELQAKEKIEKENAAQKIIDDEIFLEREVETLREALLSAQHEIQHLVDKNNHLAHELHKVHGSRSWKMTKAYRYAGLQFYLFRQYGLKQRIKHLVKKVLKKVISFLRNRPVLKNKVLNLLHKLGVYNFSYRLYRKVNPVRVEHSQHDIYQEPCIEKQIANPSFLPPVVHEIYLKLKNN